VWCETPSLPACPSCGGARVWIPFVFRTDLYGTPRYCEASDQSHATARDRDRTMRQHGFRPCGDSVGGARNIRKVKGTVFSYPGSMSRGRREGPDPIAPGRTEETTIE